MTNINEAVDLKAPAVSNTLQTYVSWVDNLTADNDPRWLGLNLNAEKARSSREALKILVGWNEVNAKTSEVVGRLLPKPDLMPLVRSTLVSLDSRAVEEAERRAKNQWMRDLEEKIARLLIVMPPGVAVLQRTESLQDDPFFRYFERELTLLHSCWTTASGDLERLSLTVQGQAKFTNHLREVARCLQANNPPATWSQGDPRSLDVWADVFRKRVVHLSVIARNVFSADLGELTDSFLSEAADLGGRLGLANPSPRHIWLGAVSQPNSYFTATQQHVCRAMGWSLGDVELRMSVAQAEPGVQSFRATGIISQWIREDSKHRLAPADTESTSLPPVNFTWYNIADRAANKEPDPLEGHQQVQIPLFLSSSRQELLRMVPVPAETDATPTWRQCGCALILWKL
ncbi:MAG: uncharacterized protein KVP18_002925 [Porospora cf. gigantea A]|nr:MAG: hypothetical protein KVP18_002925 [Porospora cf. gigantea A]